LETPISVGEHALKTPSERIAGGFRLVRQNVSAVVAALATAALMVSLAPTAVQAALDFRGSCGVAMDNTSLVVELDGWRAGAMCRQEVQRTKGVHQAWFYFGPSLCSRQYKGYTAYVHDYSSFPLLGSLACATMSAPKTVTH